MYILKGIWAHGDFIHCNPKTNGYIMLGRSDGTLNPNGVRFGSAEIYNIVEPYIEIEDRYIKIRVLNITMYLEYEGIFLKHRLLKKDLPIFLGFFKKYFTHFISVYVSDKELQMVKKELYCF